LCRIERAVFRELPDNERRGKDRRGKDHPLAFETAKLAVGQADHVRSTVTWNDGNHRMRSANIVLNRPGQMRCKPAVSLRERDERLRFVTGRPDPGTKIEEARPSRCLIKLQPIIVAACIIAVPIKAFRFEPLLPEPVAE